MNEYINTLKLEIFFFFQNICYPQNIYNNLNTCTNKHFKHFNNERNKFINNNNNNNKTNFQSTLQSNHIFLIMIMFYSFKIFIRGLLNKQKKNIKK